MKKNFSLTAPNHQPARVLEQIKHDVRKYIKRERKKTLPEGVDFWDFSCKIGKREEESQVKHVEELTTAIDEVAAAVAETVYVEIQSIPGYRKAKP